jgi:hypothetical protein
MLFTNDKISERHAERRESLSQGLEMFRIGNDFKILVIPSPQHFKKNIQKRNDTCFHAAAAANSLRALRETFYMSLVGTRDLQRYN